MTNYREKTVLLTALAMMGGLGASTGLSADRTRSTRRPAPTPRYAGVGTQSQPRTIANDRPRDDLAQSCIDDAEAKRQRKAAKRRQEAEARDVRQR